MAEAMNSIVEWNRNLRRQAAALNARAGSVVFLVETFAELVARLKGLLAGATSIAAVKDPESLRLPKLDPELVQLVIADAPDTVLVGSVSVPVEYREGQAPLIRFPSQLGDLWRELPAQAHGPRGRRRVTAARA